MIERRRYSRAMKVMRIHPSPPVRNQCRVNEVYSITYGGSATLWGRWHFLARVLTRSRSVGIVFVI